MNAAAVAKHPLFNSPMKGNAMPENKRKPKDVLADQELIGFARRDGGEDQALQRASSAKVLLKGALRDKPEQPAASAEDD